MQSEKQKKHSISIRVSDVADLIDGKIEGDPGTLIHHVAGLKEAENGDLTFLANPKYRDFLSDCKGSAVIVGRDVDCPGKTLIKVDNPYHAFIMVLQEFFVPKREVLGISDRSVIERDVDLGKDVTIYPNVFIGSETIIGDRATIFPGVHIGRNCRIGSDTIFYPNVTVLYGISIGDRVIIHAGAVVGSDGFGYIPRSGVHHKIPQLGGVIIEEDVEIGACTTIDRATLGNTFIGKGSKIDNLVQIGHNVHVGEGSIIVAQVGIAGSVRLGHHVTLGGKVGTVGHITIGDGATVAGKAGITKSIPPGETFAGFPAKTFRQWLKQMAFLDRGQEFIKKIKNLENRIDDLEKELGKVDK